jgi:hypothetical protein
VAEVIVLDSGTAADELPPLGTIRHPLMIVEDKRLGMSLGIRTKPWSKVKIRGWNWPRHLPPHTAESLAIAKQFKRHVAVRA